MNSPIELTQWQKKQAALLYHFASLDYLKRMQNALNDTVFFVERILDLSQAQDRDQHLISQRWGHRETSENWANNAWPFLKDFQLTTARQIAERAIEKFNITGMSQFQRGIDEYSMDWASPDEQDAFRKKIEEIYFYSKNIDNTLDKYSSSSRWYDFNLTLAWQQTKSEFLRLPKFRVRSDIEVDSNKTPQRTGVYVATDDQNASLQFAWRGSTQGRLLLGRTFNSLGLDAIASLGRTDLWLNEAKMLSFVQRKKGDPLLKEDAFYAESDTPGLATELVARTAFTKLEAKWQYVEMINGEFEDYEDIEQASVAINRVRLESGSLCEEAGYYFTPAKPDSRRYFAKGERLPDIGGTYGATIWQWDTDQ
ncbi:hypothetical protein GTP45_27015 [Pseudoduganella sp. FT55W]|uniref:Uncharacterized protein n=1 Tax=Duganella rivi TaxID=2666083 RepID=A0A7X4KDN0_9BURK|nr:hypothetical protein [Duganella rivi]MYM70431.1 hypothetical protein [Duganella rivi]